MALPGRALIIVENNSVPFDARVWREACALRDKGWLVSVICPKSSQDNCLTDTGSVGGDFEVIEDIRIHRFSLQFAQSGIVDYIREYCVAFYSSARLSFEVLRHDGFDVLQFCNPPDIFFPLATLYRMLGKRIVFDHHDLVPEIVAHRFTGRVGRCLYLVALVLERLTFRAADVVLSTNQSYRRIAIDRGRVRPEHVFVVRNGPETPASTDMVPDPSLKGASSSLVCYLGIMGPEDGIEPMMEAIKYVVLDRGRKDIQFALIGDGPLRSHALQQVKEWDLHHQVSLPGRIPWKDVQTYLSTGDIGLSPDPYTPLNDVSTMNKIMEYMAFGNPVVSFDLKEARVTAGDAAVYVPCDDVHAFGEAIISLTDDPSRRESMGELGQRRIEDQLAWEHQKQCLCTAYQAAQSAGPSGTTLRD